MKKTVVIYGLILFAVINFGFTSYVNPERSNSRHCPYLQQMSGNNECPYLNSKKPACPYLKGEVKESESSICPYSRQGKTHKSSLNNNVKLPEEKIS